jgi:hypothetical protein
MGRKTSWFRLLLLVLPACAVLIGGSTAYAQSSSTNYKVEETYFGNGGELNACSSAYCAKQSAGETAVGRTSGASYEAWAGFNTTDAPFLEFSVAAGSVDLGNLDTSTTATASTTFRVRTYLASGYVVTAAGLPPTYGPSTIDPLASPTASSAGTEQFGMNLRDNATPNVGADKQQIPDASFSFGQVSSDYNTPDLFKYLQGDTIAYSNNSSGETVYTVSYILNTGPITPAGQYVTDQIFVATATF